MNSNRLPGKALLRLFDKPMIAWTLERMKSVPSDVKVILTTRNSYPWLSEIAAEYGWEIYAGEDQNVLKRFTDAALHYRVDEIIRATGDNPLLSSEIALETLEMFLKTGADICHLSPVPYGTGVEVVKTQALISALNRFETSYQLEHVTPYLYQHQDQFRVVIDQCHNPVFKQPDVRLSVDTPEDYYRVNRLIRMMMNRKIYFSLENIVSQYLTHPENLTGDRYLVIGKDRDLSLRFTEELQKKLPDDRVYFTHLNEYHGAEYELDWGSVDSFVAKNGVFHKVIFFKVRQQEPGFGGIPDIGFTISLDSSLSGFYPDLVLVTGSGVSDANGSAGDQGEVDMEKMAVFLKKYQPVNSLCPYCCAGSEKPLVRHDLYNLYYCRKCGLYYSIPFYDYSDIYQNSYFLDDYKNQYGKTYEEDRDQIRRLGYGRLNSISRYQCGKKLLDFGSALGFFGELAGESGYDVTCVDISDYAVNYINQNLGIKGIAGDEKYFENCRDRYDVITSFYVIEHIRDFERLIFLMKNCLNPGGVLALSTPNGSGISVRFHFKEYVKVHPKDHYRIFTVPFMKKFLKQAGFGRIRVRITGIHPERIIRSEKILKIKLVRNFIVWIAGIFQLGDTFEIYAQKL
jgi:spore coat polysaccharide biosynthesis protein SpsF (cytidylyltransferase family)/2-polyprenyl-3-methyl-5-hydroxy-6-metoxy-1,4-benzoquinol methylase